MVNTHTRTVTAAVRHLRDSAEQYVSTIRTQRTAHKVALASIYDEIARKELENDHKRKLVDVHLAIDARASRGLPHGNSVALDLVEESGQPLPIVHEALAATLPDVLADAYADLGVASNT